MRRARWFLCAVLVMPAAGCAETGEPATAASRAESPFYSDRAFPPGAKPESSPFDGTVAIDVGRGQAARTLDDPQAVARALSKLKIEWILANGGCGCVVSAEIRFRKGDGSTLRVLMHADGKALDSEHGWIQIAPGFAEALEAEFGRTGTPVKVMWHRVRTTK